MKKLSFKKNEGKHLKLGNAFSKLSSLDEVDFDGMLAEFNCMSLRDAGSLKKLDLGHVCNVAENALSGLTSLEEVHVPVRNEVHSLGLQQLNVLKKVIVNLANEDTLSSLCPGLLNDVHADEISFEKHGLAIAAI